MWSSFGSLSDHCLQQLLPLGLLLLVPLFVLVSLEEVKEIGEGPLSVLDTGESNFELVSRLISVLLQVTAIQCGRGDFESVADLVRLNKQNYWSYLN